MFVDMYNITFVDMMELKFVISILFTCSFSSVYSIYRWIKKGCQVIGFDNTVLRLCLYMAFCEDDEESLPYDLIRREIPCSDLRIQSTEQQWAPSEQNSRMRANLCAYSQLRRTPPSRSIRKLSILTRPMAALVVPTN